MPTWTILWVCISAACSNGQLAAPQTKLYFGSEQACKTTLEKNYKRTDETAYEPHCVAK